MVEKIFVFLISPFFIAVSIWYYSKFKSRKKNSVNHVQSKSLPPIVLNAPPAEPPRVPVSALNRTQRRRMEKLQKKYDKNFVGKKLREDLRAGKIVEANDFLKQYFNDGKK